MYGWAKRREHIIRENRHGLGLVGVTIMVMVYILHASRWLIKGRDGRELMDDVTVEG